MNNGVTVEEYLKVLLPSIGVALIFFLVMRSILMADRKERAAMEEFYQNEESTRPAVGTDRDESVADGFAGAPDSAETSRDTPR